MAPFGLVIGVSAAQAHIPTLAGWLTGPADLRRQRPDRHDPDARRGAAPLAVIVTALVINLRLILYSAAMATYWRGTPLWWRLLAGYLLIDPSFVGGNRPYEQVPDRRRGHAHYLGGAVVLWVGWLVAIAVGATAGGQRAGWLHLEFLIPLYLIGEIVPKLRQPGPRRATFVASAVALLCLAVPLHLGIALAIVAGTAAGFHKRDNAQPNAATALEDKQGNAVNQETRSAEEAYR